MRGCVRAGLALAVIVCGACGTAMAGEDGGSPVAADAGAIDAGRAVDAAVADVGSDAGQLAHDGGRDGGHVSPPDAFVPVIDAGPPLACNLYQRERACDQCPLFNGRAQTCRRAHLDTDPSNVATGAPECQVVGSTLEHNPGGAPTCRLDSDERNRTCGCGLFCHTSGRCVRYCDPAGEPCPDTEWGEPQHCVTHERGPGGTMIPTPIPYCHF